MAYCASCGKKKHLRWPKNTVITNEPVACSQRCMADWALGMYASGPDSFTCINCGEDGSACEGSCED